MAFFRVVSSTTRTGFDFSYRRRPVRVRNPGGGPGGSGGGRLGGGGGGGGGAMSSDLPEYIVFVGVLF